MQSLALDAQDSSRFPVGDSIIVVVSVSVRMMHSQRGEQRTSSDRRLLYPLEGGLVLELVSSSVDETETHTKGLHNETGEAEPFGERPARQQHQQPDSSEVFTCDLNNFTGRILVRPRLEDDEETRCPVAVEPTAAEVPSTTVTRGTVIRDASTSLLPSTPKEAPSPVAASAEDKMWMGHDSLEEKQTPDDSLPQQGPAHETKGADVDSRTERQSPEVAAADTTPLMSNKASTTLQTPTTSLLLDQNQYGASNLSPQLTTSTSSTSAASRMGIFFQHLDRSSIPRPMQALREQLRKSFAPLRDGQTHHDSSNIPRNYFPSTTACAPPTKLHELCAESHVRLDELEDALTLEPNAPSQTDARGRTPLHILSDNDSLFRSPTGKFVASSFSLRLIKAFPKAITMLDASDRMPFVPLLEDWCIWVYETYEETCSHKNRSTKRSSTTRTPDRSQRMRSTIGSSGEEVNAVVDNSGLHFSPVRGFREGANQLVGRVAEEFTQTVDFIRSSVTTTDRRGSQQMTSLAKPAMAKSAHLIPIVDLWEEVEFAFEMLSLIVDELSGRNGGLFKTSKEIRTRKSYRQDMEARSHLVSHLVAVIPTILKTVLLVDNDGGEARRRLFQMSIVRQLLLMPESVGPWLTHMLHKKGIAAKRAVDYLVLVSQTKPEDYVGGFRAILREDVTEFEEQKRSVFESIEHLENTITSLVVLDRKDTERAAGCSVVWNIMDRNLARPFVVGLLLIDFVLHLTLMLVSLFQFPALLTLVIAF